jgi:hypothetical protein
MGTVPFCWSEPGGLETVPVLADRTLPAPYHPYKMICPAAQRAGVKFAMDSLLEGTGFEPSVPPWKHRSPTQLDLRSGDGSADCMEHALSTDVRECCHAMTSWRFSLRRIASLTFTRARWSTFGHGPGLRRQERRAAVGLGQA